MTATMLEFKVPKVTYGSEVRPMLPVKTKQPMKVVITSDTHGNYPDMPHGDLMIHCGDFSDFGEERQLKKVNEWFGDMKGRFTNGIVFIAGNHDRMFEDDPAKARAIFTNGTYLQDSGVEINGWHIWGTPWTPMFFNWAFMEPDEDLLKYWRLIPHDTDILVTHGPMYGILDRNLEGNPCGSKTLCIANPRFHFFGHIHEAYGQLTLGKTTHVNAAHCTRRLNPINPPVELEIR